jgi:DNA replication ATP-dependent helicase Dna2
MSSKDQKAIYLSIIKKIENADSKSDSVKVKSYFELFQLLLEEATADDGIQFTTLFSRLAFAANKINIDKTTLYYCHVFRKLNERPEGHEQDSEKLLMLARYSVSKLIKHIFNIDADFPGENMAELRTYFKPANRNVVSYKAIIEALVINIDASKKEIIFFDDEDPTSEKVALYDIADKNDLFTRNIENLNSDFTLPVYVNFIHCEITSDGKYFPGAFIIQPDYLVDVTAIAECFQPEGASPFFYLVSRFRQHEISPSLAIGNIVNYMLDEIISQPTIEFNDIISNVFQTNPLVLSAFSDDEVKQLVRDIRSHFQNLKKTIQYDFAKLNIDLKDIFLEPSFYSRDYGIQGRLDLLRLDIANKHIDIVELKSGKPFKANSYGISASHYVQTLLYDLLIQSAYKSGIKPACYILYSRENERPLRFAPQIRAQQYEAMKVRNQIVIIENNLRKIHKDDSLLHYIHPDNFTSVKGFAGRDINWFYTIFNALNTLEKKYIEHFISFVAREQALAKTGEHGMHNTCGHASLWLQSLQEKEERFAIIYDLTINDNRSAHREPLIRFNRPAFGPVLSAFRKGDIVILYPDTVGDNPVLHNQIFKCTLMHIDEYSVEVRLRSTQHNQYLFDKHSKWIIEEDSLDSSFQSMHRSIFAFASADTEFRQRFLGQIKPGRRRTVSAIPKYRLLTSTQQKVIEDILHANDYYLLWGPPGTGKTSIVLRTLVEYLHQHSEENILLLAYTNRAVDEICDAILSIDPGYLDHFVRIGSRYSTAAQYQEVLLDQLASRMSGRQEVIQMIRGKRIFVSTVSSISGRNEIFQLKNFDTVIIDEASQIPEPMLAGLLSKFKRFILIGDHKQLPAVVRQPHYQRIISDQELVKAGFSDTGMSFFERLYGQCQRNNWKEHYSILSQQGRMHKELMHFPNHWFYQQQLEIIPGTERLTAERKWTCDDDRHNFLSENRLIFINSKTDADLNWKTNSHEALIVARLILQLQNLLDFNQSEFTENTIGVITPYRAQISRIRKELELSVPALSPYITVDTVERYQGGARDIIIISLCTNKLSQLESLVSLSAEGTDRKLNVALTRAKEQIIIIGNDEILQSNEVYSALIKSCYRIDNELF